MINHDGLEAKQKGDLGKEQRRGGGLEGNKAFDIYFIINILNYTVQKLTHKLTGE